jgi:predicted metal-dependent phosphoesterase TrpH
MRIDLHLHTSASDGQYPPAELVSQAHRHGLDVIAVTDHDTTEGFEEAQEASLKMGSPLVIPGIELSAEESGGDVHVLGYYVDLTSSGFQHKIAHFREERYSRGQRIVERLAGLGMPLDWERVLQIAEGGAIGRPHIARAMVEAGYVDSVRDAFDRFLYNGGPAYAARPRLTPEEAVALIHGAAGVAVLAHPGLLPDYETMVRRLVPAGLDGVEVVHPSNSENVRLNLRGLAQTFGLIMTGGSDFHGPSIKEGVMMGAVTPPEGCVAALQARARERLAKMREDVEL